MPSLGPPGIAAARVERALESSAPWNGSADLRDPLDLSDLRFRPDLVAELIGLQREAGHPILDGSRFPFPKPNGGMRDLADLDCYTTLDFHLRVRPIASSLLKAQRLGQLNHVFYGRFAADELTWKTRNHKELHRRHREATKHMEINPNLLGRGKLDVANYYATLRPRHVSSALSTLGVSDGARRSVTEFIVAFDGHRNTPSGLPVGPEASVAIATAALVPTDRALLRIPAIELIRWMDDYLIGCTTSSQFDEVVERFENQLNKQGLAPNHEKTEFAPQGESLSPGGSFSLTPPSEQDHAVDLLDDALSAGEFDSVPMLLGAIRSRGDEGVADVIQRHPELLRRFPRRTADALGPMAKGSGVVQDQLRELALAPDLSDPARLHVVRVLRKRKECRIGGEAGRALFNLGCQALEDRTRHPVAAECYAAANASDEKSRCRRERSIEVARSANVSVNARRAAIGTLPRGPFRQVHSSALQELGRSLPEIRPAVEMVLTRG